MSAEVRKLFMKTSGSGASYSSRSASTCRTMMSRKLRPSRTSSSDLARSMPIDVPRPPLSLITAVRPIACFASSSGTSASASAALSSGSMVDSGTMPVSPLSTSR